MIYRSGFYQLEFYFILNNIATIELWLACPDFFGSHSLVPTEYASAQCSMLIIAGILNV